MAHSILDIPQLQRAAEAFTKTRPRFILYYLLTGLLAYAAMYVINLLAAPIMDGFVTVVGNIMLLVVLGASLAVQVALAADTALDLTPSLGGAANNYTRALPLAFVSLLGLFLLMTGLTLFNNAGLIVSTLLVLWFAPLIVMYLGDSTFSAPAAFGRAVVATIQNPVDTLALLLFNTLVLAAGAVTVIGIFYAFPLVTVASAITYRDLHGIEHG